MHDEDVLGVEMLYLGTGCERMITRGVESAYVSDLLSSYRGCDGDDSVTIDMIRWMYLPMFVLLSCWCCRCVVVETIDGDKNGGR
jgi:hypothetical protein